MPDPHLLPIAVEQLVAAGFERAGARLTEMLGCPVELTGSEIRFAPIPEAIRLFGVEDGEVTAVHMAFRGGLSGQAMLILTAEAAQRWVEICLSQAGLSADAAAPALATSALSEVGNVAVSSFVNAMANELQEAVVISPPQVVVDWAAAILGSVLPMVETLPDQVLLVRTNFGSRDAQLTGSLLLLPDGQTMDRLQRRTVPGDA